MIFYTIAAAAAALDLGIKQYVLDNVAEGQDLEMVGGHLILRKVYNRGAAFNLLEKYPQFVMKLSALLGAVLLVRDAFLMRKKGTYSGKSGDDASHRRSVQAIFTTAPCGERSWTI